MARTCSCIKGGACPRSSAWRINNAARRKSSSGKKGTHAKRQTLVLEPGDPGYFYHLRQLLNKSNADETVGILKQIEAADVLQNEVMHAVLFEDLPVTLTLLANSMEKYEDDNGVQRSACSILTRLLRDKDFDLSKLQIIGIGNVVRALCAFPDDEDLASCACEFLSHVCQSKATIHLFDQLDTVKEVMELLEDHQDNIDIQKAACLFLYRLANSSSEARTLVLEANFHAVLFKACKRHRKKDVSFQKLVDDMDWTTLPEDEANAQAVDERDPDEEGKVFEASPHVLA